MKQAVGNRLYFFLPLVLAAGCGYLAATTPRTYLEGDPVASYERVFGEPPPPNVQVLSSVEVDYSPRPGGVTTDDWAFELVVPRIWLDRYVAAGSLIPSGDTPPEDQLRRLRESVEAEEHGAATSFAPRITRNDLLWRIIDEHKSHPIRDWYAPRSLESYDVYYDWCASIPCVALFVERATAQDGRVRVFIRKTLTS